MSANQFIQGNIPQIKTTKISSSDNILSSSLDVNFKTNQEFKINQYDPNTNSYVRTPLSIDSAGVVSIPNGVGGEKIIFSCVSTQTQFQFNAGQTNFSFFPYKNLISQNNLGSNYTVWNFNTPTIITIPKTGLYRLNYFFYIWCNTITFVNFYDINSPQNAPIFSVFSKLGDSIDCATSGSIVYNMTAGQQFAFNFGDNNTLLRLNITISLIG